MPKIPNNIPNLSCSVEDFYLRYFKENLGNFEIDLKVCFFETKENFEKIQKKFDEFLKMGIDNFEINLLFYL